MLPSFEKHGVHVRTILSDDGREYCGWPDKHRYEHFLQLGGHRAPNHQDGTPQSNGCIKRYHRTLSKNISGSRGGRLRYETVEEMQKELDA